MFALKEALKKLYFHFPGFRLSLLGAAHPLCVCLRFAHVAWYPFREHCLREVWVCFPVVDRLQSVQEETQLLPQKA